MQRWICLGLLLIAAACDSRDDRPKDSPDPAQPAQKIQVLVAVYPAAEMVQRVGGEFVEVHWLAEGAQRPEEVESTPELRRRAARSGLVVTSGPWDRWAHSELTEEA